MKIAIPRANAVTLLFRALRVSAGYHGVAIELLASNERPWASATFEGARQHLRLALTGANARQWLAMLPDAELPMRGHIIADLAVDTTIPRGDGMEVTLTALALVER